MNDEEKKAFDEFFKVDTLNEVCDEVLGKELPTEKEINKMLKEKNVEIHYENENENEDPVDLDDLLKELAADEKMEELEEKEVREGVEFNRKVQELENFAARERKKDITRKDPLRKGCPVCGEKMVIIRGRYSGNDNRIVCLVCLANQMDMIREILDPSY
jgi:CRISPR/Cas system-associated protein Cas10 (large subunit of type III CRISPR-Cas system)